jgi:hypothetical protein
MQCCLVLRGAGMMSDQTEVTAILSVLAESVRRVYSCQNRRAWSGSTLPIPPRGQSGGEVMSLLRVAWLSLMKGSWPTLALALGLVFLDQLGLGRSGSC